MPLAPPAAHDRPLRVGVQFRRRPVQPAGIDLAIAVDELHQLDIRGEGEQPVQPGVPRRAAVNGTDNSRSTTSAPSERAASGLPSVEPESTYTTGRARRVEGRRQRARRSPSFRPIATTPTRTM